MIKELLAKEIIKTALNKFSAKRTSRVGEPRIDLSMCEGALSDHLRSVENWSAQTSFSGASKSRDLREVLVPQWVSPHQSGRNAVRTEPADLLSGGLNLVVLGHPGAGK